MKKMSRVLILLLAATLVLPACAAADDPVSDTAEDTTTAETTVAETELSDDLEKMDFGGVSFTFLTSEVSTSQHAVTVYLEDDGDILESAFYRRTQDTADKYNVKFTDDVIGASSAKTVDLFRQSVSAGDQAYDVAMLHDRRAFMMTSEGFFTNIDTLPHTNLEKPYWNQDVNDAIRMQDETYLAYGSMVLSLYDFTHVLLFNKDMQTNLKLENPYTLVENGTWTLDKMAEMMRAARNDANGDGIYDDKDNYGMMSWRGVFYMFLLNGCGNTLIEKDADDIPVFTFYNEEFVNSYEKILNIIHGEQKIYFDAEKDVNNHRVQEIMFPANQVLFWSECISWAKALREMEANFGILPAPKFDEAQQQYYSCNNGNFFGMSVPVSVSDAERASIIIEALQSASTDTVLSAYYDITLKSKYSRDEESSAMVDIIFDTTTYDCSTVYSLGNVKTSIYTKASENDKDLASFYNKQQKALGKTIDKMVEKILELE